MCVDWIAILSNFTLKDTIGYLLQIVIAGGAIWLAIETGRLRKKTQEQVEAFKLQGRLSLVPYFTLGGIKTQGQSIDDVLKGAATWLSGDVTEKKVELLILQEQGKAPDFVCLATNHSNQIAVKCTAFIYHQATQEYYRCRTSRDVIRGKTDIIFAFYEHTKIPKRLVDEVAEEYGTQGVRLLKKMPTVPTNKSYFLLFFQDIENRIYCTKKDFVYDDKGAMWFKEASKLYYCT